MRTSVKVMGKVNSRIDDSRKFFEAKFKTKFILEEFEKLIFQANAKLNEAIQLATDMEELSNRRKAYYFLHRTRRLKLQLDDFKESKGYEKKEFDFLYKLLDKIDENESTDFLDTMLRGSIEKVAQSLYQPTISSDASKNESATNRKKNYFTFTYRGVYFISPKYPQKLIRNIKEEKSNVQIGSKRYPIHPGPAFGIAPRDLDISDPTHLCILKIKNNDGNLEPDYRCFFYHKMDREVKFDESTVLSRLRPLEKGASKFIQSYFRYAGKNYYLIET